MEFLASQLERVSWYFDYDGSLCPHLEVWEKRVYDPERVVALLGALAKKSAKVLWNTGRRPESLGGVHPEYLKYSGYFIQGTAFWDGELQERHLLVKELPPGYITKMEGFFSGHPRFKLEKKPTSLRIAPGPQVSMDQIPEILTQLPEGEPSPWEWIVGHRGAELLPRGFNKGSAVEDGLKRFGESLIPIAIGDDLLDKAAVEVAIARGGYAFVVGESVGWITEVKHRPDQVFFCESPADLHEMLWDLLK